MACPHLRLVVLDAFALLVWCGCGYECACMRAGLQACLRIMLFVALQSLETLIGHGPLPPARPSRATCVHPPKGVYALGMVAWALLVSWRTGELPPKEFRFLFVLSFVCLIVATAGLYNGAFAPEVIYATEFTTCFGSFNVYVWILAFAYYPVASPGGREMQLSQHA